MNAENFFNIEHTMPWYTRWLVRRQLSKLTREEQLVWDNADTVKPVKYHGGYVEYSIRNTDGTLDYTLTREKIKLYAVDEDGVRGYISTTVSNRLRGYRLFDVLGTYFDYIAKQRDRDALNQNYNDFIAAHGVNNEKN